MTDTGNILDKELTYTSFPGEAEGQQVLQLSGPVTLSNVLRFQDDLRQLKPPVLIVNMEGVPYMDSAGLGIIMNYYVSTQRAGRRLILAGVSGRVMTLFRLTKVDSVLVMFPDLPSAFASLH